MKILLIQPNNIVRDVINLNGTEIPLNLLYLANAISKPWEYLNAYNDKDLKCEFDKGIKFDWCVEIIDLQLSSNPIKDLKQKLKIFEPDMVGFTGLTIHAKIVKILSRLVKNYNKKILVIFGGIHASALPKRCLLEMDDIDLVVTGEGEITLLEICHVFQQNYEYFLKTDIRDFIKSMFKNIKGIAYRNMEEIVITSPRPLIQNLDAIPFPNRDLLNHTQYTPFFVNYWKKPTTGILSSRGCPYSCSFCSKSVYQRSFRQRSPENVFEEMIYIKNRYNIKDFRFFDDTITLNKKWVKKFCYLLLKNNCKFYWNAFSRADTIDEDTLRLMKQSGCYHLKFGVETYSYEILNRIKKQLSKVNVIKIIKASQNVGIETLATFILNFPNQSIESIQQTIEFSKLLNPTYAMFFILKPLPGSQMYLDSEQNNDIIHFNWELYGEEDPPVLKSQINHKDSQKMLRNAYNQFYLRPAYIFARIVELVKNFSPNKVLRFLKGFLSFFPSKKERSQ